MFEVDIEVYFLCTVSPRREATWLITEGGLLSEFTSQGLYGENVFQMTV